MQLKVYFIGAGPGDPELITVKGLKFLKNAQVIIYAGSLINQAILEYASTGAELYDSAKMTLEEICDVFKKAFDENKDTARLHSGDPAIYGAIQEQIRWLEINKITYEIIPGVSSFTAAAAMLGREFTIPYISQSIILTRLAGRTPVPEKESLDKLAQHRASLCLFLSIGQLEEAACELKKGYPPETPAVVVHRASYPDAVIIKGTLSDIAVKTSGAGIKQTALLLVGDFLKGEGAPSLLYDVKFSHSFRQGES
ncbi:MAG: precorrin-4 C(11)-methyltransferase [Actinobacteria bacterium]|nr:precorrin-4 C(11)-methyltransferase [Actinomycetota bacterium]